MSNQRGLTLLELLIALGLVGLVAGIALGSLRLASHAWERGEARLDTAQRTRFVTDLLTRELRSALPYLVRVNEKEQMVAFSGASTSVKFLTTAGGLTTAVPEGALREVTYALAPGGLYRVEAPASDRQFVESGRGVTVQLEPGVVELSFRYLQRSTGTWLDNWVPAVVSLKPEAKSPKPEAKSPTPQAKSVPPDEKKEPIDPTDLFPGAVAVSLSLRGEAGQVEQLPPLVVAIRSQFPPAAKTKPEAEKDKPQPEKGKPQPELAKPQPTGRR
ncbi:MAG: prepilin-type N-terminal cleavage/methylation domain-containing protein [Candidatus Rokubacteria bacterium]|nr:prepilin-type N-terminal cleavage/methylation domain-containing protein [Candidatus Rokubacteria bacterium]